MGRDALRPARTPQILLDAVPFESPACTQGVGVRIPSSPPVNELQARPYLSNPHRSSTRGRRLSELQRAEELAGKSCTTCIRLGGSIIGEHGVKEGEWAYLAEMLRPGDIAVMRRQRREMDPAEIANQSKMPP